MRKDKESLDNLSHEIKESAKRALEKEPLLGILLEDVILSKSNLFEYVATRLSRKLGRHSLKKDEVYKLFCDIILSNKKIKEDIVKDFYAIKYRDPACESFLTILLYYKGFHAVTVHRIAHELWNSGRRELARYLQSLSSEIFAVDIHPAARFGGGILLDHATSFVAGETSVVEDNVSILHEVTLGGTGNEIGDRHPKVRSGVLIGSGSKLIGNIEIGEGSKIGAGSVVLNNVEPHTVVAGVPAKYLGKVSEKYCPSQVMNQEL